MYDYNLTETIIANVPCAIGISSLVSPNSEKPGYSYVSYWCSVNNDFMNLMGFSYFISNVHNSELDTVLTGLQEQVRAEAIANFARRVGKYEGDKWFNEELAVILQAERIFKCLPM